MGRRTEGVGKSLKGVRELEGGVVVLREIWGEVFIGPRGSSCEGVKLRETLFMAEARWGLVVVCSYVSCAFFSCFWCSWFFCL